MDTDRTQALIGFVKANGKATRNLAAGISNNFAALVLTSMDTKPIARADKMLLTAGSRVANTGMKWNPEHTRVLDQGGSPSLIEPVSGTITLRNLEGVKSVTATALDGSGAPIGKPIEATQTNSGWTLPIGDPVTTWYVINVKRK